MQEQRVAVGARDRLQGGGERRAERLRLDAAERVVLEPERAEISGTARRAAVRNWRRSVFVAIPYSHGRASG